MKRNIIINLSQNRALHCTILSSKMYYQDITELSNSSCMTTWTCIIGSYHKGYGLDSKEKDSWSARQRQARLHTVGLVWPRAKGLTASLCAELAKGQHAYILVWEPVSMQKGLLVLSQNQCFKFRNHFCYKDTFIYHINLEDLKKQNFVAFFVCVFKDMVVERKKYPENLSQFVTLLS